MRRKLIRQANQAYTITLPISWVRRHGLSERSEVDVLEQGKSLTVSSSAPVFGERVVLRVDEFTQRNLYRHLTALYARGVDEIELHSKKNITSEIVESLHSLLGFVIVSQEKQKYVLKDISSGGYADLEELFKRVFQMIILFYQAALDDIFGLREETLEHLKTRDAEINKFCLYLQRAITKSAIDDPVRRQTLFTYSYALEAIGDEIERLWRTAIRNHLSPPPSIKKLTSTSLQGLERSFDLYYSFRSETVEEIYSLREEVREKSLTLRISSPPLIRFVRHTVKVVEAVADLTHLTLIDNLPLSR